MACAPAPDERTICKSAEIDPELWPNSVNHGGGRGLVARMIGNVLLDTVVGSPPILGSVFNVFYKANSRNIRVLRSNLERMGEAEEALDGSRRMDGRVLLRKLLSRGSA